MDEGRHEDAVFETRLATTRYPSMAIGWKLRGEALLRAGKPQDAAASLSQAIIFYRGFIQNQRVEQARVNTGTHNTVFNLSEAYRLRAEANSALGNQQVADEDAAISSKYRSYTQGKLLPLYQLSPSN